MFRNLFTLKRLFDFKGRASRREYFLLLALWFVGMLLPMILLGIVVGPAPAKPTASTAIETTIAVAVALMSGVIGFGGLVAMIAAGFRRLHDQGNSAAFLLLGLIPAVGWLFLLIMLLFPGQTYDNEYGRDPRDPIEPETRNLGEVFG